MKNILIIITVLHLISCASVPPEQAEQAIDHTLDKHSEQLIAENLVSALTQLLPRDSTTIAIDDTGFNALYWRILVRNGYAIRVSQIPDDLVRNVLRIEKRSNSAVHDYFLSFNELVLQRKYTADIKNEKVYPISPMFVTGAGTTLIDLNDQKFEADREDGYISSVVLTKTKNSEAVAQKPSLTPSPVIQDSTDPSQLNDKGISDVIAMQPSVAPLQQYGTNINPSKQQETPGKVDERPMLTLYKRNRPEPRKPEQQKKIAQHKILDPVAIAALKNPFSRNMFDLKQSNYQSLFEHYEDIHKSTIIFGNDSFILGRENKKRLIDLTNLVNLETDVISVIGCSHGRTGEGIENSMLAISRANRVKEELMRAGMDGDRVLEEACYAKEYADELGLPRRGVQIRIKRLKI